MPNVNTRKVKRYTVGEILKPFDFGNPVDIGKIYDYLVLYNAGSLAWYQDITVLDHIASVAWFSIQIAARAGKNNATIDTHKTWLMSWLHDVGRIPWGIAVKQGLTEITKKYGHHGYLGYKFLLRCKVPEYLAIISMTHIAGGLSTKEVQEVNDKTFGYKVFPVRDWLAKTLEEKIIVIADKILGWNNTVLAPYEVYKKGNFQTGKIYGEVPSQDLPWKRFWNIKKEVDKACGCDVSTLFSPKLLASDPRARAKLPKPQDIATMQY